MWTFQSVEIVTCELFHFYFLLLTAPLFVGHTPGCSMDKFYCFV